MIRVEIDPDKFFKELQPGVHLCTLGKHMQRSSEKYRKEHPEEKHQVPVGPPKLKYVPYKAEICV